MFDQPAVIELVPVFAALGITLAVALIAATYITISDRRLRR